MLAIGQSRFQEVTVLYDGECPLCRFGMKNYECGTQSVTFIDMRAASALKDKAISRGFNLNKEIVIECDNKIFSGGEAIHLMATQAKPSKWFNRQVYRLFHSPSRSKLIYPLLSGTRRLLSWLMKIPPVFDPDNERKESTIKKQLAASWDKLNPNVQSRFAVEPAVTEHIFYRGIMDTVECSFFGKLFAQLTRLIANPLTPYEGKNIHLDVMLYRKTGLAGVYWRRTYYYLGREPYTITSVKRADKSGKLTECVGAGFGMLLDVSEQNGNLLFRSKRYFWNVGLVRIPFPHWLTPGETQVLHEDLGEGFFRFTIAMNHIWLGRTFYQTGIFQEA